MKKLLFLFNKGIVKKISALSLLFFSLFFPQISHLVAGTCSCPDFVDVYEDFYEVNDNCEATPGFPACTGSCDVELGDGQTLSFECAYNPSLPIGIGSICGCSNEAASNDCYLDVYDECQGFCYNVNGTVIGECSEKFIPPWLRPTPTPIPSPSGPSTPMPGGPSTPTPSGSSSGSTPGGPSTPLPGGTCKCDAGFLPDITHKGKKASLVPPSPENPDPCEEVSIEWCTRTDCEIKYAYEDGSIAFTYKTKCSYVYDSGRAIPPGGGPATPNPGAPISGSSSGSSIPPGGGGTRPTGPVTGCLSDAECGEYCCIGGVCNSCKNRIDQLEGNDAQKPSGGSIFELIINRQFNNNKVGHKNLE